jgi:hypothetical protein
MRGGEIIYYTLNCIKTSTPETKNKNTKNVNNSGYEPFSDSKPSWEEYPEDRYKNNLKILKKEKSYDYNIIFILLMHIILLLPFTYLLYYMITSR